MILCAYLYREPPGIYVRFGSRPAFTPLTAPPGRGIFLHPHVLPCAASSTRVIEPEAVDFLIDDSMSLCFNTAHWAGSTMHSKTEY